MKKPSSSKKPKVDEKKAAVEMEEPKSEERNLETEKEGELSSEKAAAAEQGENVEQLQSGSLEVLYITKVNGLDSKATKSRHKPL